MKKGWTQKKSQILPSLLLIHFSHPFWVTEIKLAVITRARLKVVTLKFKKKSVETYLLETQQACSSS